jgi:hypothetical protein
LPPEPFIRAIAGVTKPASTLSTELMAFIKAQSPSAFFNSSIVFVKVVILKVSVNSTVNGLQLLLLLV